MLTANEIYLNKIKQSGLSDTRPRRLVFEALHKNGHSPLGMNELIKLIPEVDRSSIYRSVEALERAKVLHRLYIGWKYKLELSEEFHGHHHHITCNKCGAITASHDNKILEALLHKTAQANGYKMSDHQIEIRGTCTNCQN